MIFIISDQTDIVLVALAVSMAGTKKKAASMFIKMVSSARTGFFYVQKRNPKNNPNKRELIKYDPVVKQRVVFTEQKLK